MSKLELNLFEKSLSKGETKRLKFINAATTSLVENGIEGTTYESIAKIADVRRSHINYYFKSVDEIISQCFFYSLSEASEYISQVLKQTQDSKFLFKNYVQAHFDYLVKVKSAGTLMLLIYYTSSRNEKFRKIQKAMRESGQTRIYSLLMEISEEKVAKEVLQKQVDLIQGLIVGNIIYIVTLESEITQKESDKWAKKTLQSCELALNSNKKK